MATGKQKVTAPVSVGANFGSLDMYVAGGGIPEGDYIWTDLTVQMYTAMKQNGQAAGPPRLGMMITMVPKETPTEDHKRTQFYSFGSSADKSWMPREDGKGIVPIAGGAASTLNNSTNWMMLLQSLYDCGMPPEVFTNDCRVIEGIHVHMTNVPEPKERAGFQQNTTGEASAEPRKNNTVSIVSEIHDDGKPWEGTGGIPAAAAAPKVNGKAPVAMPKPAVKASPAPVAAATEDKTPEIVALETMNAVLEANPTGLSKAVFRSSVKAAIAAEYGAETAASIDTEYFSDVATLTAMLNQLAFTVAGVFVRPMA